MLRGRAEGADCVNCGEDGVEAGDEWRFEGVEGVENESGGVAHFGGLMNEELENLVVRF